MQRVARSPAKQAHPSYLRHYDLSPSRWPAAKPSPMFHSKCASEDEGRHYNGHANEGRHSLYTSSSPDLGSGSPSSAELSFEDLFDEAGDWPVGHARHLPEEGCEICNKIAMLMSMFAPQNRFCAELRSDISQLLSSHHPDLLRVDHQQLACDLCQKKGYRVRVCQTEGACFCLGAHKHVFLEICASSAGQPPFEEYMVVELTLRQHFEVARPSKEYSVLLDSLPHVFVGTMGRLMQLVKLVVTAMAASLQREGMSVPPWRSPQAVMANWCASRCICGRHKSGVHIQRKDCPVHPAGQEGHEACCALAA